MTAVTSVLPKRQPQVSADQVAQERDVLLAQRPVEGIALLERGDRRRRERLFPVEGPPGTACMRKNVSVAMAHSSGISINTRRTM
jgi:hypothetical protein